MTVRARPLQFSGPRTGSSRSSDCRLRGEIDGGEAAAVGPIVRVRVPRPRRRPCRRDGNGRGRSRSASYHGRGRRHPAGLTPSVPPATAAHPQRSSPLIVVVGDARGHPPPPSPQQPSRSSYPLCRNNSHVNCLA